MKNIMTIWCLTFFLAVAFQMSCSDKFENFNKMYDPVDAHSPKNSLVKTNSESSSGKTDSQEADSDEGSAHSVDSIFSRGVAPESIKKNQKNNNSTNNLNAPDAKESLSDEQENQRQYDFSFLEENFDTEERKDEGHFDFSSLEIQTLPHNNGYSFGKEKSGKKRDVFSFLRGFTSGAKQQ